MVEVLTPSPEQIPRGNEFLIPNFASFYGESLMPPSDEGKRITPQEFKEEYAVRYDIWQKLSQNLTGHLDPSVSIYNPNEIQKLKTRLHFLNNLDRFAAAHHGGTSEKILRVRQMNVFEDFHDAAERGEEEMIIKAPPGFGKTVIFNQMAAAADVPTLIVVPSMHLVEQTYQRFQEFTPHIPVGRVYTKRKEYGRQVTITTYASLVRDDEGKLIHPEGIQLVVLDEQQEGTSEKRIEKFDAIDAFKDAIILGVSATPVEIQDPRFENTRIAKMSRNLVHEISDQEAVEEGYTAPFTAVVVEVDTDISDLKVTSRGNYDEAELERRINTETQNKSALEYFLQVRERDRQEQIRQRKSPRPLITLGFVSSIAHAQELAREFIVTGVPAAAVWGNQNGKERDRILRQWKAGEIEVVFCKDLLVRGTDIPSIRHVMNIAPTFSAVVEKQRSGRGGRLDEHNPDKHLLVSDFVYKNFNKRHLQVLYPQTIGAATIVRKNVESSDGSRAYPGGTPTDLEGITIEGLKIVTDPEEVMRIVKRIIEEKYQPAPEGWNTIRNLSHLLSHDKEWIDSRLPQVLQAIQQEQDKQGVPEEERGELYGEYLDSGGHPRTHYGPLIQAKLKELASEKQPAPEGWVVAGNYRTEINTLIHIVSRARYWIDSHLPEVLQIIQHEQDKQGIPEEEREELYGEYLDPRGRSAIFYGPLIQAKLKELASEMQPAPEGWIAIGESRFAQNTLAYTLSRSPGWIRSHLPEVLQIIQHEQDKQGIPEEEREELFGEYLDRGGRLITFYGPLVQAKLRELASEIQPAPEGWMIIGRHYSQNTLSGTISRDKKWIVRRLPQVLHAIQQELDEQGIPEKVREKLLGEYLDIGGRKATFYGPQVIDAFKKLSEQEQRLPSKSRAK